MRGTPVSWVVPFVQIVSLLINLATWMWMLTRVRRAGGWVPAPGSRRPSNVPRLLKEYWKMAREKGWPLWPAIVNCFSLLVVIVVTVVFLARVWALRGN